MSYPEVISYLESFINYEKIPSYPYKETLKLERTNGFLKTIGNPQRSLKCLHIAGTKGKGSTCAFISYILRQAGYKTGLYTSPHLSDFRERIRVLIPGEYEKCDFEGMIPRMSLGDLTQRLKPAIDAYNKNSTYGPLSFFEVYTAIALTYFKDKKTDFVVLETGLGGRLDATNAVNPLVCVITPISYEHTDKLGSTLREIAAEKAGIIKSKDAVVITARQQEEAMLVIEDKCSEVGAKLLKAGEDITYVGSNNSFKIRGFCAEYPDLKIKLIGEHQLINAALAVGAIEALSFNDIQISLDAIRQGLNDTVWPGRCEAISESPFVVLDGAQNIASANALAEAIKKNFNYEKLILVLGVSSDKDKAGICKQFYDLAHEVILTKADNPRAANPQSLGKYFLGKNARITANAKEAKELVKKIAGRKDLVLVTGSLFLVGEYRND